MADVGPKVPGTRKNPEPEDVIKDEVDNIPADKLQEEIGNEIRMWEAAQIHPMGITHDIFALDGQVMTVVWVLIDMGIVTEDEFNERYQRTMLRKLKTNRSKITQSKIAVPEKPGIVIARG